ncbi:hypothetical protein MBOL_42900 [Mycobacteroides abscessus subsp. bolletii BD]|nr:hypothetical protein MBOL_42900 [Mycobacteroides abscessus subsp. bolletii BD]
MPGCSGHATVLLMPKVLAHTATQLPMPLVVTRSCGIQDCWRR